MKQLQQSVRSGQVSIVEVPSPRAAAGQVLVRVSASLISAGTERMVVEFANKNLLDKARARPDLVRQVIDKGQREGWLTTLEAVRSRLDRPLALGYSNAGTVVDVGRGVSGFRVGDRVACAGGGYATHAEMVSVPVNLVAAIPSLRPAKPGESAAEISFDEAAFTTLGAIAMQGIRQAEPRLGEVVVVIGLGLLGQMTVQMLRANGCRVVGMDIQSSRTALALSLGADAVATDESVLEAEVQRLSNGHGADSVLITADTKSNEPVEVAGAVARQRGVVVAVGAVGMTIPRKVYYEKELDFRISRSYGPGRYDPEYEEKGHDYPIGYVRWTENRNMQAFLGLMADGRVDVKPLISHRFPIDEATRAYELITGQTGEPFLGVVLNYPRGLQTAQDAIPPYSVNGAAKRAEKRATSENVTIGLLGAGNFAMNVLLPAMKKVPGLEMAVVATASGLSARHAADRFGFERSATDQREVLEDPAVNTVVIATRHHLHARQVLAALDAGKHVFCEKPLALHEDELRSIVERYDERGRDTILTVGFNRRFAPMARQLKRFLGSAREPLAMHYRVNAGYLPPEHWVHDPEVGGGRIVGEVCHFVDFLTFLAGALPQRVHARGLPNAGRFQDDNVVVMLEFADGSLGTITYVANGDKSFPKERVEVFGGGGAAVLDDFRRLDLVRDGRKRSVSARLRQDKGHQPEWEAFAAAVRSDGATLPLPFEQLVSTTLATFAIREALTTGKSVVVDCERFMDVARA